MQLSDRIRICAEKVGSGDELSRRTGIPRRTLENYLAGDTEPKVSSISKISEASDVDAGWLVTGYGSPESVKKGDTEYISIPVMNAQASAGHGSLVQDESATDFMRFNKEWLRTTYYVNPSEVYIMPVDGESMEPTIRSGELILIKKINQAKKPGDGIYVVRLEGTVLVKRIQFMPQNKVKVSSDNQFYDPYELQLNDGVDFAILGRVLSCLRAL